jgi:hypothetical protein
VQAGAGAVCAPRATDNKHPIATTGLNFIDNPFLP